jgi:cytochrome c oxidase cbb3-type subunit 3
MFVASIIFAIGYLAAYPGLGKFPGLLGWTQITEWQTEVEAAELQYGPIFEAYRTQTVEAVASDPKARKMGQRLFANNCAQCHGSDARGSHGFPNLTDSDWLYGGDTAAIKQSITYGRAGQMPAWGPVIGEEKTDAVTAYVQSLSGQPVDAAQADAGKAVYETYCIACHGAEGKGNPMFGAPDLTDNIWLYGSSGSQIRRSIANGRQGQMPAHKDLLDESRIHLIAAYVYSLSQAPAQ